jgi:hypothetical protein
MTYGCFAERAPAGKAGNHAATRRHVSFRLRIGERLTTV